MGGARRRPRARHADREGDRPADDRLRRPRAAALRAHASRRLRARVERDRLDRGREADLRARARGGCDLVDRRGALRGARADRRSPSSAATCCCARRTSSAGRISGSRTCGEELAESWRPYKARPSAATPTGRKFETGTLPYELLAGFSATIAYLDTIGGIPAVRDYERELGEHMLENLPANVELYGLPTMEGRVPTFLFNVDGVPAATPPTVSPSRASPSGRRTTGTASRSARACPSSRSAPGSRTTTRATRSTACSRPWPPSRRTKPSNLVRTSFERGSRVCEHRAAALHEGELANHVRTRFERGSRFSLANQISLTGVRNPRGA